MTQPDQAPLTDPVRPPCYRHGDRMSTATCRRCERPICWECMAQAPVGWQCTQCVRDWSRKGREIRYRPKAVMTGGITPMVLALIAVNLAMFLASHEAADAGFVDRFAMVPGAIRAGQWYRLLTATFLHESWLHIGSNMLSLYFIGPVLEANLGRIRFLGLYLLSGIGGEVCSYLLSPFNIAGIGASGAIFGLLGALLIVGRHNGTNVQWVLMWLAINLVIGFEVPGIDWRAHLGGFFTGAVVAYGFTRAQRLRRQQALSLELATAGGVLLALALLALLPPGDVNLGSMANFIHIHQLRFAVGAVVTMGLPTARRGTRRVLRRHGRAD